MDNKSGERKGGGGGAAASSTSPPPLKSDKFTVYRNPAIDAALDDTSLRLPSSSFILFSLSSASVVAALLAFSFRENNAVDKFKVLNVSEAVAYLLFKGIKIVLYLAFGGVCMAFVNALVSKRSKFSAGVVATTGPDGLKVDTCLSSRQLCLLGLQKKPDTGNSESPRKPPVSRVKAASASSDPLVPLHQHVTSPSRQPFVSSEKSSATATKTKSFGVPTNSTHSPASFRLSPTSSQLSSVKNSSGVDLFHSTPWSNKRGSPIKEAITEDELELFLADVDKKITESAEKLATPPPVRNGFNISSPSMISGASNTSGTMRLTPLRSVRMSPSSQKYTAPPKKGEAETPSPMSMDESIEAFKHLGIYPEIEEWRDRLRQWFSSVVLSPLLGKMENSHTKVMQAVAKLGISVTVSPVGSDSSNSGASTVPIDHTKEWQPTFTPDEDGLLNQLRASLVQSLDASTQKMSSANQQQNQQQNAFLPIMQECLDAITEHQRLLALVKGELIKGLLPQSSIPAEYAVSKIKELGEGTCLKNYEYMRKEGDSDKLKRKWTLELPTDSHLLLYLFCAFLEYPKWMLHLDPSSYSGAQSSKNPLFLGALPPKERFPEKYVAVISVVPSTIHPGASVLVIGKQCPPVFIIYWEKKMQLCLQGRTALWDSILLLSHRIKTAYGGLVRGIHLGSTALSILPVLESEEDEE